MIQASSMVTTAGEGTSCEGGNSGGGAGGKFLKWPFRRPQAKPYDRPPTALRNPRTSGWLSKLVDPASKLISASDHLFFSSVSRKRLPPPPPPPPPTGSIHSYLHTENTDLKAKTEKESTFGNLTSSPFGSTSFTMASAASSIFGFSASAPFSSANNLTQTQGSLFGTSSGSSGTTITTRGKGNMEDQNTTRMTALEQQVANMMASMQQLIIQNQEILQRVPAAPPTTPGGDQQPGNQSSNENGVDVGNQGDDNAQQDNRGGWGRRGTAMPSNLSYDKSLRPQKLVSTTASPAGTGVATVTKSMPIQFGLAASPPIFGTSGITSFTSSSSLFGGSTSSSSVFGSSTSSSSLFSSSTPKVFGSSTTFGLISSASSSETNSVSSSGATTSWQPPKSSPFNSTFRSVSPSTGFSFSVSAAATNSAPMVFGASTGASSGSTFSFTSAAATASSSQPHSMFGSSVPVFAGASGNGDQMSMEDSMAEDPIQASTPTVQLFVQPPISTPSSGFVFGSTAPPAILPFQLGSQQNQGTPQNPSPFPTSGSVDFSAGGSFSLGSGGGDKSNRKIVKVKHKSRRR